MVNTAFVFPGQGSQSIGMLADLLPEHEIIATIFNQASEAIGYDVWQLIQNGPIETLNQTEHTQVAMLVANVALYKLLMHKGIPGPKLMAGHSLGEYAALVCANTLPLVQAVRLVARRGQLMQNTVPLGVGAMAAIVGLNDEEVQLVCIQASNDEHQVSPANYNAIGQVVIAGHTTAVNKAIVIAENSGARLAKVIPVSVPCHCSLLKEAAAIFAEDLTQIDFKSPTCEVIANVDLTSYKSAQDIRAKLTEQLYSPVRWVETIQLFAKRNTTSVVECGPGKVLNGLIKRIDRSLNVSSVYDTASLNQVLEQTFTPA